MNVYCLLIHGKFILSRSKSSQEFIFSEIVVESSDRPATPLIRFIKKVGVKPHPNSRSCSVRLDSKHFNRSCNPSMNELRRYVNLE
jgi:hypothetical protein